VLQEEEGAAVEASAGIQKTIPHITMLVCVGLSIFFLNSGFLSLFFLVPLGYAVLISGYVWPVFLATAAANIVFSIITHLINGHGFVSLWMEIFYFTSLFLCFTWIMGGSKFIQIRTLYRFILGSVAGAFAFLFFIVGSRSDSSFEIMLRSVAEMVSSILVSTGEADAVRRSSLQQTMTPERIFEVTKSILLRGGALTSIFFIFYINRYLSLTAIWLIKKQKKDNGLKFFYAPPQTIWVLTCSLALVLLSNMFRIEFIEIITWNVFTICVIIFLAQGAGILMFLLTQRSPTFRLVANVLIIILIFSPGLNTVAITALLLLGIIGNFRPIRNGYKSASTPEP